jgi:putative ABC transport system substrate-binding protein
VLEDFTMRRSAIGLIGIVALAFGILAAPLALAAPPPGQVFRIGWLALGSPSNHDLGEFQQGLRELGYVEGQNIVIEYRWAEGNVDRLGTLATDLVQHHLDVIMAVGAAATRAAQQATSTLPIVMVTGTDAVAQGFVGSLARPGGNITGIAGLGVEVSGKRLELLKEVVPTVSRIAALWNAANAAGTPFLHATQAAAQALGVELQVLEVRTSDEFEGTFAAATRGRAEALIVMPDAFLADHLTRIVELAQRHRLPGMYPAREYVDAGGLMAYNAPIANRNHRAATYVDKILKGAKPADVPVEQPTKFTLVINLKAAKAIGLTMPPSVLFQADEVIR